MKKGEKIKVLVVDDSFFMRKLISDLLNADPQIEVIATARNGQAAIDLIKEKKPDVVTLDYQMPGLDGLATLKKMMKECPVRVVMLSAYVKKGGDLTLECLKNGAIDFILKPSGPLSLDIETVKTELLTRVRAAAEANLEAIRILLRRRPSALLWEVPKVIVPERVIVIGASTGGPAVVELILSEFPQDLPCGILVVQHMPLRFTELFAQRLDKITKIKVKVKEAQDGDRVKSGIALIAPGNQNMTIVKREIGGVTRAIIKISEKKGLVLQNAIDTLMLSVAQVYGPNAICVILTGMGEDGVKGAEAIKKKGGTVLVQDEATSIVFGMPKRAIEEGIVDKVLPISQMSGEILRSLKY